MIAYSGPNAEQIRYWNDIMGPQWAAVDDILSAQIRPLGLAALKRLDPQSGERVIDIGCGCGETTAEIARRVGLGGRVVGVDISEPLGVKARKVTAEFPNVEIRIADAQTSALESEAFDALFSRFGVMFFADPVAAFANLRSSLRVGGRISFVCWREISENLWMTIPAMAVMQHIPVKRPDPNAPGPFAFADIDRLHKILESAGFQNVQHEALSESLFVAGGEPLDGAVELLMRIGPTGAALREANPGADVVTAIRASIREAISPFETPEGVRMPSAAWVVTAQRLA